MNLIEIFSGILNHPLNKNRKLTAIKNFVNWQLSSYLYNRPIIYNFTDRCRLVIEKGMTGATGNLYCGLHEFNEMIFLLHYLRKEDLFIDIGSNIGSYSILASGHVGCNTISIEPIPNTFNKMLDNINLNRLNEKISPLNIAIGSRCGKIHFTRNLDTVNHVAVNIVKDTIEVEVDTLDNVVKANFPNLLKIDVEGYETEVINGGVKTLEKESLRAIIIELNGSGERYNYDESQIHKKLLEYGYKPCIYLPGFRELKVINSFGTHNTIYARDFEFVNNRLKNAENINILNQSI